jgi:uncharacterized protein YndB with AHSA1/START domain
MTLSYGKHQQFSMQRVFEAPPEMVFEAWTKPEYLDWFFNPDNPTDAPITVDLRVGGQWRQEMVISPTERYFTGGLYREIVPNAKLVFAWGAEGGWPELDPARPDENPRVTLEFTPHGEQTVMDLLVQFPDHMTDEKVEWWMNCGMREGWDMTIDRLVARYDGRGGIRRAG